MYGFYIHFESFFMLFPMIEKVFLFWGGKKFYLTGGPDDVISRDHHNYKNVTIVCLFFFHYFPIRNISMNKICL